MGRALRQADVQLRVDAQNLDRPVVPDLKTHVGPVLRSLSDQLETRIQALQTEALAARDQITRLEDAAAEKDEDCSTIGRSVAVLEQQCTQDKEVGCGIACASFIFCHFSVIHAPRTCHVGNAVLTG